MFDKYVRLKKKTTAPFNSVFLYFSFLFYNIVLLIFHQYRVHVFKGQKVPKHVERLLLSSGIFCQSTTNHEFETNLEVSEYCDRQT